MAIAHRICSKCGIEKPLEDFYKTSNGRGIGGCRAACKECENRASIIRVAEWRKANPGKRDEQDKRYREQVGYDVLRERSKRSVSKNLAYYALRAAQWRAENPDKVKEICYRYCETHRWERILLERERQAKKRGAPGALTKQEWMEILERHEYRCAYCGRNDVKMTMDHIVPLSRGGQHVASNVVPACRTCNTSKGARPVEVFLERC